MLLSKADVLKGLPEEVATPPGEHVAGAVRTVTVGLGQKLEEAIGDLVLEEDVHLVSFSRWSMVGLLELLLQKTGPADVLLTSWTITEEPMRKIVNLMAQGHIRTIGALFDDKAPKSNPEGVQLAMKNIKRLRFLPIHAKCIVVINERWGISVASSANLTRNKRIERYVISTRRSVAEFDRTWIEAQLSHGQRS